MRLSPLSFCRKSVEGFAMIAGVAEKQETRNPKNNYLKNLKGLRQPYMMIAPSVILVILFGIYPILNVLLFSFTEYDGFSAARYIGFRNYLRVMADESWWLTVWNTIVLGIGVPLAQIPLSLLLAHILNSKFKLRDLSRTVIFLPNITSTAIVAIIFYFMFSSYNGIVNGLLIQMKLIQRPVEWLANGSLAKLVIIIFQAWHGVGFYMVLFLAALQKIPKEVYESATIDGSGSLQTFYRITLPLLGRMFQIISALSIVNAMKLFDTVKALTNGGPGNATEVMTMYIFRYFFESTGVAQQGYASAVSIVATLIVAVISLVYLGLTQRMKLNH